MIHTPLCDLLGIRYPVFQGGMAWIADGKLAAAVSEGGGLGIIAAGNAPAEALREQIQIAKSLTKKPFGVNIMLMSPFVEEVAQLVAEEKVAVVTTGAGNPSKYMALWKEAGIKVIPVVASVAMAKLMTRLGASALIAEGGVPGEDEGYAVGYLYSVNDEGEATFEEEPAYIGEAPNFMEALKEPVAYTDEEIDE